MDTLVVFHYHLLPGGVRSALAGGLKALCQRRPFDGWLLRLLAGRPTGVPSFVEELEGAGLRAEAEVDARLDYRDGPWPDERAFREESLELARWLLSRAQGSTLFWVHNPTLGKSPLVTAAWLEAARMAQALDAPHRFLYHIHDFVECGRMENLLRLRQCWPDGGLAEIYPATSNVGYATLNRADGQRLVRAGIPPERVFYLPNAVTGRSGPEPEAVPRKVMASSIGDFSRKEGYRFHRERPWWVLPVRLIRRKNVLEAVLLAALEEGPVQLLLTLDANSPGERPYAEAVKALVKKDRHPMVVGFGRQLVGKAFSMHDLLTSASAVATTSLLEGFGFAFVDGPMHGAPLAGRDLPDVTRDFHEAGFPAEGLYERLTVPLPRDHARRLQALASRLTEALRKRDMASSQALDRFREALKGGYEGDRVDFGLLDLPAQTSVLSRLGDPAFVQELRRLNPGVPRRVAFPGDFVSRVLERFGPERYAERLQRCFSALLEETEAPWRGSAEIANVLLEEFLTPSHQRPLLGGWS